MHSAAWFDHQLSHARLCLAQLDGELTLQQTQAAHHALAQTIRPQPDLFTAPPYAGVMTGGQPEPSWLADSGSLGC